VKDEFREHLRLLCTLNREEKPWSAARQPFDFKGCRKASQRNEKLEPNVLTQKMQHAQRAAHCVKEHVHRLNQG